MSSSSTMRAVIFKAPGEVAVEDRPIPQIRDPTDVIIKVKATALCGSDLHFYRGHMKVAPGFIIGHEFTGIISEIGSDVKNFKVGVEVVVRLHECWMKVPSLANDVFFLFLQTPFTTACGECFYCQRKQASRCETGVLFGELLLPTMNVIRS